MGTGIGAGVVAGGRLVHGLTHPELGHLRVPRHPGDGFAGACPDHGDCLEGLAAGPALAARWGSPAHELEADEVWELEAWYVALGLVALVAIVSPQAIVLSGGIGTRAGLRERVEAVVAELLGDYVQSRRRLSRRDSARGRAWSVGSYSRSL